MTFNAKCARCGEPEEFVIAGIPLCKDCTTPDELQRIKEVASLLGSPFKIEEVEDSDEY